jgi:hypothetical protein
MRRTSIAPVGMALLIAGCVLGPTVDGFAPATTPAGLDISVQVERASYAGELLAVEDTALLMVVRFPNPDSSNVPRLARVATRRIRHVSGVISMRGTWTASNAEEYRPLSRYPQGVNAELEARLAAAYHVAGVRWVPQ